MKIALYGDKKGNSEIISKYPAEYENSVNDFLNFLRCGINEYPFGESYPLESIDIRKLVALSEYYDVTPAVCRMMNLLMLNRENEFLDAELRAEYFFKQFNKDFKHIADFFEKNKIWYVPLKNAVLLEYRTYDTLYINGNSFLIAPEGMALMERLFRIPDEEWHLSEYKVIPSETTEHCVTCYTYTNTKCRFYTTLFEDKPEFRTYCEDMLSRLKNDDSERFFGNLKTGNYPFMRYLGYSDMYIYLILCNYIDYCNQSAKLSSLAEIYCVCYWEMKRQDCRIDFAYVENELQKLNIAEFEKIHRSLALKLFSVKPQEALTVQETEMLGHYLYPDDFDADKLTRLERRCEPQTVYGSIFSFDDPEEDEVHSDDNHV